MVHTKGVSKKYKITKN